MGRDDRHYGRGGCESHQESCERDSEDSRLSSVLDLGWGTFRGVGRWGVRPIPAGLGQNVLGGPRSRLRTGCVLGG